MNLSEVERAWWGFVGRWKRSPGSGPQRQALLKEVLDNGLAPSPSDPDEPPPADEERVCHIALVGA